MELKGDIVQNEKIIFNRIDQVNDQMKLSLTELIKKWSKLSKLWNYLLQNWRSGQPNPIGNLATCLYTEANGIPNDHDGDDDDYGDLYDNYCNDS